MSHIYASKDADITVPEVHVTKFLMPRMLRPEVRRFLSNFVRIRSLV
jgi:hypothetical protein